MEWSQRDRLSELVEQLTTSGEPQLDQESMKEIKNICKYVANYYCIVFLETQRNNVRFHFDFKWFLLSELCIEF